MGTLFIVATPIGNLKDITMRAIEVLKIADYILCEDTRVTGRLLHTYQIDKNMISFNDFNEEARIPQVLSDLGADKNIALVSDAGTPLISDPGFKLVRAAAKAGIRVESIPGPTAVIAALTVSGFPPDKFLFVGYPPKKEAKKKELFKKIKANNEKMTATAVLYESPHRAVKTLNTIKEVFGDIDACVSRELTKVHEEIIRGKISEIISRFSENKPKGELVIVLGKQP